MFSLFLTLEVTNVGENKAESIDVNFDIPKYTTYISHETTKENVTINKEENRIKVFAQEIEKDEKIEVKVKLEDVCKKRCFSIKCCRL